MAMMLLVRIMRFNVLALAAADMTFWAPVVMHVERSQFQMSLTSLFSPKWCNAVTELGLNVKERLFEAKLLPMQAAINKQFELTLCVPLQRCIPRHSCCNWHCRKMHVWPQKCHVNSDVLTAA